MEGHARRRTERRAEEETQPGERRDRVLRRALHHIPHPRLAIPRFEAHREAPQPSQMRDDLRKQGIFLRYFDTPALKDCIRISIGTPKDTDALIWALRAWEDIQ